MRRIFKSATAPVFYEINARGLFEIFLTLFVGFALAALFFFLIGPDKVLPDLGDSILSLFIMRWGVISFPDIPQFWPNEGGVFYQEHLLGPGLILNFFKLFWFNDFEAYYGVLSTLFVFNFSVTAMYVRQWGAHLISGFGVGFGAACFPYLLDYGGHLHNWPIACLIILGFEGLRYIETGQYKFYKLVSALVFAALFSMTVAYFCILFLLMFILVFPSILRKIPEDLLLSRKKVVCALIALLLYGALTTYYAIYSRSPVYSLEAYANYAISGWDVLGFLLGFGHVDSMAREADKFPVLASLMMVSFLVFGRDYLSKRAYFGFLLFITIFGLLATGPVLISTGFGDIPNPVFLAFHYLPGFGSMRVANRFLLASSALAIVAGSVVWIRISAKSLFIEIAGVVLIFAAVFLQTQSHLNRLIQGRVPTELVNQGTNFIDRVASSDAPVVAHFPFSEHGYEYLLYSLDKWRPTPNGVTTFFPPDFFISRDMSYNCLVDEQSCGKFFHRMKNIGTAAYLIHRRHWWIYPVEGPVMSPEKFALICKKETTRLYGEPRCLLQ